MVSSKIPKIHLGLSKLQKVKALFRGVRHGAPFVELSAVELERHSEKDLTSEQAKARDKHLEKILSRANVSDICRLLKRNFGLHEQHELVEELKKRYWNLFHEVCDPLVEYYVHRVDSKLLLRTIREDIEERGGVAEWPGIGITHEALLIRKMADLFRFRKLVKDLLSAEGLSSEIRIALSVLSTELSRETYDKMIKNFLQYKIKRVLDAEPRKKQDFGRALDH